MSWVSCWNATLCQFKSGKQKPDEGKCPDAILIFSLIWKLLSLRDKCRNLPHILSGDRPSSSISTNFRTSRDCEHNFWNPRQESEWFTSTVRFYMPLPCISWNKGSTELLFIARRLRSPPEIGPDFGIPEMSVECAHLEFSESGSRMSIESDRPKWNPLTSRPGPHHALDLWNTREPQTTNQRWLIRSGWRFPSTCHDISQYSQTVQIPGSLSWARSVHHLPFVTRV
jgi:hypothetical protein